MPRKVHPKSQEQTVRLRSADETPDTDDSALDDQADALEAINLMQGQSGRAELHLSSDDTW